MPSKQMLPFLREAKETPPCPTSPGDATGRKAVAGVVCREASSVEDFLSTANLPWRIILNNPTLTQRPEIRAFGWNQK